MKYSSESAAAEQRHPSPKQSSLRRNFSWTFTGNVVYAACQWGMLMILSKVGSPEMVGQFALGTAITTPVLMLTNLNLRVVQATDAREEYGFGDYLGLRLISTVIAFLVIVVIVGFSAYPWETAGVILIMGLAKAFESVSDVCYGLLQHHERMDRIARSMMIKGGLSVGTFALLVLITNRLVWGVAGLAATWAIVLLTYDFTSAALILRRDDRALQWIAPRWNTATLFKLFRLSLPLGFVMMLFSLNTNIPRYFIAHYWGERTLGIFAAMAYLLVAGTTVVAALGQSASPRLSKYYAQQNKKAFRALLLKLVGIGAGLGGIGVVIALLAGKKILTVLYGPEYAQHDVFLWIMVAAAIGYVVSFLGYGITATRQFHRFTIPYIIVTVTALIASSTLIPSNGLIGAAWTLLIMYLASCITTCTILIGIERRHYGESSVPDFN